MVWSTWGNNMSQLVKAVMATDTGNRKVINDDSFSPIFKDVFDMKEQFDDVRNSNLNIAKVYKIGVTLGNQAAVSELDAVAGDTDALHAAIERCRREIVEAVFGEFRQDFMLLNRAIYDRDFQKARALLTEFERKMFEVE